MFDSIEVVKELQEMRDDGFLSDALLRRAVKSIAGSDDKLSWVGAFLMREEENKLWLHNYVGEPARWAEQEVGTGVVGTAAAEKANKNIPDVTSVSDYEPCGPDTSSELVVLIRAGDEVYGQIDLASEDESAFGDDDESAVQAVCDKLAEQIASERR